MTERIELLEDVEIRRWDGTTTPLASWPAGAVVTRDDLDPEGTRPGFFDVLLEGGQARRADGP